VDQQKSEAAAAKLDEPAPANVREKMKEKLSPVGS